MAGGWVSVVPTFRPTEMTVDLVTTLAASGPVVVSDDASPCTFDPLLARIGEIAGVSIIRNTTNRGIGRALNQGLAHARDHDLQWLLTVDQDSHLDEGYAASMVDYAQTVGALGVRVGAVGAGRVLDASGPLTYPHTLFRAGTSDITVTEEVVQSGTLWSVAGLAEMRGFDESLGMDAIDAAACVRLRARGYRVVVHPNVVLEHQIEGAQQIRVFGRNVMVTGHSPTRRRSMVRNRLRLFPEEFTQSPRHAFRTVRRSVVNVLAMPLRRNS